MADNRVFPLQPTRGAQSGPRSIPWSVAEKAYAVYSARFGTYQSLERLAERGGFGWSEMDEFYPQWRSETDEIASLRARVAELETRAKTAERRVGQLEKELADEKALGEAAFRGRLEQQDRANLAEQRNSRLKESRGNLCAKHANELRRQRAEKARKVAEAEARASAAESRVRALERAIAEQGAAHTESQAVAVAAEVREAEARVREEMAARVVRLEGALQAFVVSHERECGDGLHRLICTCQTCALARAALAASDCRCGHTDAEHYADAEARGSPCRECVCLGMDSDEAPAREGDHA